MVEGFSQIRTRVGLWLDSDPLAREQQCCERREWPINSLTHDIGSVVCRKAARTSALSPHPHHQRPHIALHLQTDHEQVDAEHCRSPDCGEGSQ